MASIANYRGIIPAISCPFTPDHRIDEPALRKLASWLAGHDGVVAVMTNGHTGEVFSLTPAERAQVTRIVADKAFVKAVMDKQDYLETKWAASAQVKGLKNPKEVLAEFRAEIAKVK